MATVNNGDKVKVNYTGKLEDGSVFDSSEGKEPLEFTVGDQKVIPGFEKAVEGLSVGETTTVNIPSDKAYGERRDDLELAISKSELPDEVEPKEGMQLQMKQKANDEVIPVTITNVEDDKVTIDANHPLAGKNLVFDIEVVDIAQ
ncbi:MAG TPA: peptidylprolyl isomerase [Balneolaceae bacterium]|nr:peptidylprolyl isomerase [Balneolaceae bacterium]